LLQNHATCFKISIFSLRILLCFLVFTAGYLSKLWNDKQILIKHVFLFIRIVMMSWTAFCFENILNKINNRKWKCSYFLFNLLSIYNAFLFKSFVLITTVALQSIRWSLCVDTFWKSGVTFLFENVRVGLFINPRRASVYVNCFKNNSFDF
jgi:hypothetical protein